MKIVPVPVLVTLTPLGFLRAVSRSQSESNSGYFVEETLIFFCIYTTDPYLNIFIVKNKYEFLNPETIRNFNYSCVFPPV